jgi:hypothetical protein
VQPAQKHRKMLLYFYIMLINSLYTFWVIVCSKTLTYCELIIDRLVRSLVVEPTHPHYVKTSNRSHNICNRPLTPVTYTHICCCYLAPVTDKRGRSTPGVGLRNARYKCGLLVTIFLNACYMKSL